jgi:hypothetical protein
MLVIGALAMVAIGLTIGFLPVKSNGYDCGSAFREGSSLFGQELADAMGGRLSLHDCADARSSRQPFAWGLVVGGAVLLFASRQVSDEVTPGRGPIADDRPAEARPPS